MKIFLVMAVCLLLLQYSHAQQKEFNNSIIQNKIPVIQKGYYSIYNNAEKLSRKGEINSSTINTTQKGYYAIAGKKKHAAINRGYNHTKPVVKKGYYSIKNNSKKLQ